MNRLRRTFFSSGKLSNQIWYAAAMQVAPGVRTLVGFDEKLREVSWSRAFIMGKCS